MDASSTDRSHISIVSDEQYEAFEAALPKEATGADIGAMIITILAMYDQSPVQVISMLNLVAANYIKQRVEAAEVVDAEG